VLAIEDMRLDRRRDAALRSESQHLASAKREEQGTFARALSLEIYG
jgi:hypothetical protein